MIVLKSFILRENAKKYNAGDDFPRETVASYRCAELIAKGYLKGEDDAIDNSKQEEAADEPAAENPAKKSAKKTTSTAKKARAKKG